MTAASMTLSISWLGANLLKILSFFADPLPGLEESTTAEEVHDLFLGADPPFFLGLISDGSEVYVNEMKPVPDGTNLHIERAV